MNIEEIKHKMNQFHERFRELNNKAIEECDDPLSYILKYDELHDEVFSNQDYWELEEALLKHQITTSDYTTREVPEYADVMTIDEFVECVESGGFIDYDGSGYYMTNETTETDIPVNLTTIRSVGEYRKDMPFVAWYNR